MKNLRIAIQKKGRLNKASIDLLRKCGLEIATDQNKLIIPCPKQNIEILFVRDDDIPMYLEKEVADAAILGLNEMRESSLESKLEVLRYLDFARCRLSIAGMNGKKLDLENSTIATSYPKILKEYLSANNIKANIVEISGCVEIAPKIGITDYICDLVSTGATLKENGLQELLPILTSEAVLIKKSTKLDADKELLLDKLLSRIEAVLGARNTKYVMMNAPIQNSEKIAQFLSSMESPTILPLLNNPEKVAIHAATREDKIWDTIENLKQLGASSILVSSIAKVVV